MSTDGTVPAVLVLRALGLGDLLTGVPALRAVRRHWPGHRIVLAAPARLAAAAAATGCVDRLLPTTAPARAVPVALPWTGPPPDVAIDLHGNGAPSHRLLRTVTPAHLIGFARAGRPPLAGPTWRADEHERDRWCRLLRWHGVEADPTDLRLSPAGIASPAPDAVVLHPGADAGARRWPPARFAAVARALRREGRHVVVSAGAGERALAEQVAAEAGLPPGSVIGGPTDVPFAELTALVSQAAAVVCGDTGLSHLAVALGTPSVTLFGPVSPQLWGPPDDPRHAVLWPGAPDGVLRPGDAHGAAPDPRLLRITAEQVLAAVRRLPEPVAPAARGTVGR
ncbi:glycosyltransferase family 9 protein [Kitasatospora sp. RB6PN24]|uniref:glycosyltransferase family 9 protein n=1 Tax=Kitasatospora humi TaxID=2893891 RepID=UPI001E287EE1|nr:glycosyltransferase family 9 protein [Kitasatospora humi]MCC9305909.1 glycosyltransferase family 9 protein [Kitasatospora humi]